MSTLTNKSDSMTRILLLIPKKFRPVCFQLNYNKKLCKKCPWKKKCKGNGSNIKYGEKLWNSLTSNLNNTSAISQHGWMKNE